MQDGYYPEQVMYRLYALWKLVNNNKEIEDIQSHEQYVILDDLIETKRYDFLFWTHKNAL